MATAEPAGKQAADARALAARDLPVDAPGLRTLGYRELLTHVAGERTPEEAIETIALRTRQLAKRQETWFRKEPDTRWFTVESEARFAGIAREIARIAAIESPGTPRGETPP